ncbi:Speedy protein E4, partial [Galemys pyrenaicus]
YLLSMVIAYFSRAGLFSWQYQRIHFFLALYLANDMEEDNQAPKQVIFAFLYGKKHSSGPYSTNCDSSSSAFDPELWVWGRDRTLIP